MTDDQPRATPMMKRRHFATALSSLLGACASPEFKPLVFPPDVVLQDPPPGTAVVYLLRAPHDRETVTVYFGQQAMATLPPSTYAVVVVAPGAHEIRSSKPDPAGEPAPAVLTLGAGERRFLYTSVPTRAGTTVAFIPGGPIGVIPLLVPGTVRAGARTWNECSALDAQGLMSTARPVVPAREPG